MAAAVEGKISELSRTTQSQQDFIAAFTHEVKTPMTAMLGYADLMRARPDDAETQREAAGYIYHETQRLENLSRSLLALMGLDQAGALELVLCQDAGLLLQTVRSLPQGSTPVPRVISAGCVVRVDRSLWVDMLRNLTLNAQRACQGIEGAAITLRCERRDGQAVFTVTDTGCGIPAADLPPRDRGILHGGQVPQPGCRRQRHRAGALCPYCRGAWGKAGNHQHRACRYDRDYRRAGGTAERKGRLTMTRKADTLRPFLRCAAVVLCSLALPLVVFALWDHTAGRAPHPNGRGSALRQLGGPTPQPATSTPPSM